MNGAVASEVQVGFRDFTRPLFTLPGGVSINSANNTASINTTMEFAGLTFSGDLDLSADTAIDRYTVTGDASINVGGSSISLSLGDPQAGSEGMVLQNGRLSSLTASVSAGFDFKGLSISVQDVMFRYEDSRFELSGGINVATRDTGSTQFNVGAVFGDEDQPGMVIEGGEVTDVFIVANGGFSLNKISLEARNLTIDYSSDEDRLELSGGVNVAFTDKLVARAHISDQAPFVIDTVTGALSVGGDGVAIRGGLRVGPFDASVGLSYQDPPNAGLTLTTHVVVELPQNLTIEGSLGIEDGQLTSISLTYEPSEAAPIPIGSTGFFVEKMTGSVDNLDSPEDIIVSGNADIIFGKRVFGQRILSGNGEFTIDADHLNLKGTVELAGGQLGTAFGEVDINWDTGVFRAGQSMSFVDGAIQVGGGIRLDRQGNVNFQANVGFHIPDSLPFGGKRLGGGDFYVQIRPDDDSETWVKVFGDILFWRVGVGWNAATGWDLLSEDDEPFFIQDVDICPARSEGGRPLHFCTWNRPRVLAGGFGQEHLAYDYRIIKLRSAAFEDDINERIQVNINAGRGLGRERRYIFESDGTGDWDGDGKSDICSSDTDIDCIIRSDGTDTIFLRLRPVTFSETIDFNNPEVVGSFSLAVQLAGQTIGHPHTATFSTSGHLPKPFFEKPPEATLIDEANSRIRITAEGKNAFVHEELEVNSVVELHYIDTNTDVTGLITTVDLGSDQRPTGVTVEHDRKDRTGHFKIETVWDGLPELADWSQRPHDPATQPNIRFFAIVNNQVNPVVHSDHSTQVFIPPDPSLPDVFRANVGGPRIESGEITWISDEELKVYRNAAGENATYDGVSLEKSIFAPDYTPLDLFRTERSDPAGGPEMRYDFPVKNGNYDVRLFFAENYVERRVFDIEVEGEIVRDRFNALEIFEDFDANGMHQGTSTTIPVSITDGNLDLNFLHVIEDPHVAGIEIIRTQRPSNDDFANAAAIIPNQLVVQDISGATREEGEPTHGSSSNANRNTVWYQWTAPRSGVVNITTSGSKFETALSVYTGTSVQQLSRIASHIRDHVSQSTAVSFSAVPGQTYRIALSGVFDFDSNNAHLQLSFAPDDTIEGNIDVSKSSYKTGEDITVEYVTPNFNVKDWISLQPTGSEDVSVRRFIPSASGSMTFSGGVSEPGQYTAYLYCCDRRDIYASVTFEVVANNIPSDKQDVTQPGDFVQLVSGTNDDGEGGDPPGNEGAPNAIDGTTNKYLNFNDLSSGLIVTPSAWPTIVDGLRVYTANDAVERDPASYLLEGSNNGATGPFTIINQADLALPLQRNDAGQSINTSLAHQEVTFPNTTAYTTYRLTFPTLRNAGAANSMQVGEVEFLGTTTEVEPPTDHVHLVNAGGAAVGIWSADSAFHNNSSDTFIADRSIDLSHDSVPGDTPMSVFQSERWDGPDAPELQWDFPVEPGNYEVQLYFAEIFHTESGARRFDVFIEGDQKLDDYDIVADVGPFKGVVKTFVVTSDGNLDIDFGHVEENPKISGIRITPTDVQPAQPSIALAKTSFQTGEAITVEFESPNFSPEDWIGLYLGDTSFETEYIPGPSGSVTFEDGLSEPGQYTAILFCCDSDTVYASVEFEVVEVVEPTDDPVYAVNVGGAALSGWSGDTDDAPYPHRDGGSIFPVGTIDTSHPSIPDGTPDELFQSVRYSTSQWSFPVTPGNYEVRLYFAQVNDVFDGAFDVSIEGKNSTG